MNKKVKIPPAPQAALGTYKSTRVQVTSSLRKHTTHVLDNNWKNKILSDEKLSLFSHFENLFDW